MALGMSPLVPATLGWLLDALLGRPSGGPDGRRLPARLFTG
jgi:hypothetical protein